MHKLIRGLSPLARGTHRTSTNRTHVDRFIPAGAGNTSLSLNCGIEEPVYPRWRGEHFIIITTARFIIGLSPLARGTLSVGPVRSRGMRFIPAGAGNTLSRLLRKALLPVYPRWSGEHTRIKTIRKPKSGLSPLARGTHQNKNHQEAQIRFIPAGAGNTWLTKWLGDAFTVYPRWRGEHVRNVILTRYGRGLSPLARGTQINVRINVKNRRFIPAGAGNTTHCYLIFNFKPVYPRWRGEHRTEKYLSYLLPGLSPLARGTPSRAH